MGHLLATNPRELRVGDTVHVCAGSMIFANQRITAIDTKQEVILTEATDDGEPEGFGFTGSNYTFYLIERPKKPLPTAIGSAVEVDGVKYVRILKDNDYNPEWAFDGEGYIAESSSERLADLDFTVV